MSAVLLQDGHAFKRHSGLRAALHQRLVATGRLPQDLGRVFDDHVSDFLAQWEAFHGESG